MQRSRSYVKPARGDEIVITGLAGKFPDSHNVHHFRDNLFNKVDMVSGDHRRWRPVNPEIPQRTGKLFDIEKFDLGFFGTTTKQADNMDPQCRLVLERVFEAILDAGHNPFDLSGTRTGVFLGACFSETEKYAVYRSLTPYVDSITGCQRSMLAKRISYAFKLKGPTYVVDTACSSSLFALEHAYAMLKEDKCDKALVCGTHACLQPIVSLQFARLGVLSKDGSCKSFDDEGNGYARSEGIVAMLLEKSKDAKRIYVEVIHCKTNCDGYKGQGIAFPSSEDQIALLEDLYADCKVDPATVAFVEAHATGTLVGDPEELYTLDQVFCKGRDGPLHIGGVKSNIGHNEAASGISSVAKVIIAIESGFIPPNINYTTPRRGVEGLEQGRMIVVTEKMPLRDAKGLFAVNSFGFGGANAHTLLRWNPKCKINGGTPEDDLPRLLCVSSRTEDGIDLILDHFQSGGFDAEQAYLIQQAFRKSIENHTYRGYGIYTAQGQRRRSQREFKFAKRDLCWVFTGYNGSYSKLKDALMRIPVFEETLQRIHRILKEEMDVDLAQNIANPKLENIINQIISSVAVQIGLASILNEIKLTPHTLIGTGSGEFIAAYLDGCITLKQTVLGLLCIACDQNKSHSEISTILHKILPTQRKPCRKWIPTRSEKLNAGIAKYFMEGVSGLSKEEDLEASIPKGATPLVIGDRAGINLSRSLILIDAGCDDVIEDLLRNLGSLYEIGFDMELDRLYPKIALPVSRGTPMLSPFISWNHGRDCKVYLYDNEVEVSSGYRVLQVEPKAENWNFVVGHVIDGRNLFPATGYLVLVWESLGIITGRLLSEMKVVFEDVKYIRAGNLPADGSLELVVFIQTGSHNFEIVDGTAVIATGKVYDKTDEDKILSDLDMGTFEEDDLRLDEKSIYKELTLRGYHYSGQFKSIRKSNVEGTRALIEWNKNWIPFMDCMLQLKLLREDTRSLFVPTGIQQVVIDSPKHISSVTKYNGMIPVRMYEGLDVIKSAGIEIKGIGVNAIPRRKGGKPVLEISKFIPNTAMLNREDSTRALVQIVLENSNILKVKVVEIAQNPTEEELLSSIVQRVLEDLPLMQSDVTVLSNKPMDLPNVNVQNKSLSSDTTCSILIVPELLESVEVSVALNAIKDVDGFVISREIPTVDLSKFDGSPFIVLCCYINEKEALILLRAKAKTQENTICLNLTDVLEDFQWVPELQEALKENAKVVVYAQNDELSGILGLVTCLRRESYGNKVSCVFVMDEGPTFNADIDFYKEQLNKNMAFNIWKDGCWGTYRHLILSDSQITLNEHCYVNATTRGDLSTISWLEGNLSRGEPPSHGKELVDIYYAAVNFKDLMTASGKLPPDAVTKDRIEQECVQGFEFSGRNSKGERVMGISRNAALATMSLFNKDLLIPVPEEWSLEDAATVMVVHCTVLQALLAQTEPKRGQTVLIHSGTGGVGLAAINVCLHYGLIVFVTVGTPEKREYLKEHYPQIKEEHVGNSRDTTFELMIQKYTNGLGVDYVLNSLADEKLTASVRCLARGGRFIEIGKFDLVNNSALGLDLLGKDAYFFGLSADILIQKSTMEHLRRLIKEGAIKPLPRTVFKRDEVEHAFRYMGTGKHIGKVLVKVREEEGGRTRHSVPKTLFKALPRFYCKPERSYLICGGLGGFGLELADLLVIRGAKKLILTSRSGLCSGYQQYRLRIWKTYGVSVITTTEDASTVDGCTKLLHIANELGPLDGIFNLAVVLNDAPFENHTIEGFKIPFPPKASGTKNLDSISRKLCPNLRYFVVFSSVSCGRGNIGQTNYGMANSVMERVCEKRKKEGYPALAVQWGAIGEVGLVAKMQENHKELVIGGTVQQRISNCLEILDKLVRQDEAIVSSMVVAEKKFDGKGTNLFDAVLSIMGITNLKAISMHATFPELGMDSMMGIEVKQMLEREYEVFLTPQDIRSMTLAKLKDLSNSKETTVTSDTDTPLDMALLLRYVGSEELVNAPSVKMNTLAGDDESAIHIIALPGIEGMAHILEPLCRKLKARVTCLQYCLGRRIESIKEIAESVLPYLETPPGDLVIVAYSIGTLVATELLCVLESKGKQARVIFIDGTPEMLVNLSRTYFPVEDENLLQIMVLSAVMVQLIEYTATTKHQENLLKCKTYQEKIDYLLNNTTSKLEVSREYAVQTCLAAYDRLRAVRDYKTGSLRLESRLTLFKASPATVAMTSVDYGASSVFVKPVDVVSVEGDHASLLENDILAEGINSIINDL